jgi:hypothetical protein
MPGEKPFCLFLSWGPPHDPYVAPDEYMDRFDPAGIRLRENVDDFAAAERLWNECDTRLPEEFRKNRQRLLALFAKSGPVEFSDLKAWTMTLLEK